MNVFSINCYTKNQIDMKTLNLVLALCAVLFVSATKAQEAAPLKVKEYGIGMTNLNGFSLQYRWGTEKRLYRVSGFIGANSGFSKNSKSVFFGNGSSSNFNSSSTFKTSPVAYSLGVGFSILNIKSVSERFGFIYGPSVNLYGSSSQSKDDGGTIYDPNTGTQYKATQTASYQIASPSIGFVLGMMYKINSNFFLYAEVNPNIYFQYVRNQQKTASNDFPNIKQENTTTNFTYGVGGLSNSGAMLTLAYRISH